MIANHDAAPPDGGIAFFAGHDGAARANPRVSILAFRHRTMPADRGVPFIAFRYGAVASRGRVAVLAFHRHAAWASGHTFSLLALHDRSPARTANLRADRRQPREGRKERHTCRDTGEASGSHGYSLPAGLLGAPASSFGTFFRIRAR
jgi:hypothetical protein